MKPRKKKTYCVVNYENISMESLNLHGRPGVLIRSRPTRSRAWRGCDRAGSRAGSARPWLGSSPARLSSRSGGAAPARLDCGSARLFKHRAGSSRLASQKLRSLVHASCKMTHCQYYMAHACIVWHMRTCEYYMPQACMPVLYGACLYYMAHAYLRVL